MVNRIVSTKATLTSDASGDATATFDATGFIETLILENGTATPDDNWDLVVTRSDDGLAIYTDASISHSADTVAYPRGTATAIDATDLTYDGTHKVAVKIPVTGKVTLTAANMGASKTAYVTLYTLL